MSDSNRTILIRGTEGYGGTNWGVSPAGSVTPSNYQTLCTVDNSLNKNVTFVQDDCIRSDRQTDHSLLTAQTIEGDISFNLSFLTFDEEFEGLFMDAWSRMPTDDNNGVADSAITQVTDSTDTFAVDDGGIGYVANHLIRTTGFADAENNDVFEISSIATNDILVAGTPTLVDDATPAATARLSVVGFAGASGDIEAVDVVSDGYIGLKSTILDFTTLGLSPGQWIKVGGALIGEQFVNEATVNDFARIVSITATEIVLDEVPATWADDDGAGKTIRVWIADTLKNGVTRKSFSYEREFSDQVGDKYQQYTGMEIATGSLNFPSDEKITGSFGFMGSNAAFSATSLETGTPLPGLGNQPLTTTSNLGSVMEAGATITGPNWIQSMDISIANNLRDIRAVGNLPSVSIGVGSLDVTGNITLYYGDSTMLAKYQSAEATSISFRTELNNQAYVFSMPRIIFESGNSDITGKDTDVTTPLGYRALRDDTTDAHILLSSFEYYQ